MKRMYFLVFTAVSSSNSGDNGIGTGSSQLEFQVTRSELGSTFTCKASSPALVESLTVYVKVDVNGEPLGKFLAVVEELIEKV